MSHKLSVKLLSSGLGLLLVLAIVGPAGAAADDPAAIGKFTAPFVEPDIAGKPSKDKCIQEKDGTYECKPTAGSMAMLPNGKILYWDALEGTENIKNGIVAEFGQVSINDQSRLLDLNGPTWSLPTPTDGGSNPDGYDNDPLVPPASTHEKYNDGALFCSDLAFLADGRLLVAGGTAYYSDPGVDGAPAGVAELEGIRNVRIYDPRTNTWSQTGALNRGRWYPSMVTLGNGDVFIASGVKKLIKPIYPDDPANSGSNVKQTETYNAKTGKWADNGASAERSLPLFPRLHLLPDGHVYFDAAGQVFNPDGQSYDEATWNMAASYDPQKKSWTELGIPGIGTLTPGFRGSTFSTELPLTPDDHGNYTSASFLSAGGVVGVTPGGYIATPTSAITTVTTGDGGENMTTEATGNLTNRRWYSTGVLLPTGQVIAFSGADKDEVVAPGTGFPVTQAELFDPKTKTWSPVASATDPRTYHNTAVLLPDGRVLVGGHAPISTLYGKNLTLPGGFFSPNDGRDPSVEIYSPPYMFWGPRPRILSTPRTLAIGHRITIATDTPADAIDSVVLVRNPSITHLQSSDQHSVVLQVIARHGNSLTLQLPDNPNVLPPGPYMLFVNQTTAKGLVPSVSVQTTVSGARSR